MYYRRKKETYLPFNLDLQVQVLYAAAALFGSFIVVVSTIGLLSPEALGWPLIRDATFWFVSTWLVISVFLALFRKTPIVLVSGFLALLVTAILGLVFFAEAFYLEDILVSFPILLLWTFMYYFFELYRRGGSLRFLSLALSICCLAGLIVFIAFIVYPVKTPNVITVSASGNLDKKYKELTEKGPYSFSVFNVNVTGKDYEGEVLQVEDLDLSEIAPSIPPIKPSGKVYLPKEGDKPYPVVFINVNSFSLNDRDFVYLAEHLASKGYATVISPLYIKDTYPKATDTNWLSGLLIIEYLENLASAVINLPSTDEDVSQNSLKTLPIDLKNVALVSFGDAINATSSACYILQDGIYPPVGKFLVDSSVLVKTLLAIAPYNQDLKVHLKNINYIAVAGGQDPYSNFNEGSIYNNLVLESKTSFIKSQIYLHDANHSYFIKNIPGMNFPGFLLFERESLMEPVSQKEVLSTIVTAALSHSFSETEFASFFKENGLKEIYPDLKSTFRTNVAGETLITDFELGFGLNSFIYEDTMIEIDSSDNWNIEKLGDNQALLVEACNEVSLDLLLPNTFSKDATLNSKSALAFSLAVKDDNLQSVYVEIETKRGISHKISLDEIKDLPSYVVNNPYKLEILNQQVEEKAFFETYAIPLYLFFSSSDYYPWQDLERVRITFVPKPETTTLIFVDDICFREL